MAVNAQVRVVLELKLLLLLPSDRHLLRRLVATGVLTRVQLSPNLFRLQALFCIAT